MQAARRIQVALMMDHPSPHMVGLLNALACREDLAAKVVYFRSGSPTRSWGDPPGDLPFRIVASSKTTPALLNARGVLRTMANTSADLWILNCCYTAPETWAAVAWLNKRKIPWVYMNERLLMRGLLYKLKSSALRRLLHRAIGMIGMGSYAASQYFDFSGQKLPSISVPYYTDLSDFLALPLSSSPEKAEPVRFLTAARMIRSKGYDLLSEACAALPTQGWTLTIAGDGPLRKTIERDFLSRWGSEKIQILGEVRYADRHSIFSGHHAFVFPSRNDGWGMAPIEAMAAGLPVISTDQVMSMREFIREGENGYLIESEDSSVLADRMQKIISEPDRIPHMGQAARAALSEYRPEIGAAHLSKFIIELTESRTFHANHPRGVELQGSSAPLTWRSLTEAPTAIGRFRSFCRSWAKRSTINASLAFSQTFKARGNRLLVYHLVLAEDRSRFENHLQFLKDHYRIVTAGELARTRTTTQSTPLLAITFDDGFRILLSHAIELLEKHGVKATFFVPTGFILSASDTEQARAFSRRAHYYNLPLEPMTPGDLRMLQDAKHEIGSHGVSHIGIDSLSRFAATDELRRSRCQIAEWTGQSPSGFAYPYGSFSKDREDLARMVASTGYEYAVTLKRGAVSSRSESMFLERDHAEGNWRVDDLAYFLSR